MCTGIGVASFTSVLSGPLIACLSTCARVPALVVAKNDFSQLQRIGAPAYKAVAIRPHILIEQALRRSIVQIDIMLVWKQELYPPQRIGIARRLKNVHLTHILFQPNRLHVDQPDVH